MKATTIKENKGYRIFRCKGIPLVYFLEDLEKGTVIYSSAFYEDVEKEFNRLSNKKSSEENNPGQ